MNNTKNIIKKMCIIAVFASLEFVVTSFVAIPLSAGGYVNLSDLFVFLLAYLINPIVGGLVGGISCMLSDLYLGYSFYIPFTFIFKFIEGIISGYLVRLLVRNNDKYNFISYIKILISFLVGGIIMGFLYMIPDYLQYIYVPNMTVPDNIVSLLFINLGFNLAQGCINSILASILILPLSKILKYN